VLLAAGRVCEDSSSATRGPIAARVNCVGVGCSAETAAGRCLRLRRSSCKPVRPHSSPATRAHHVGRTKAIARLAINRSRVAHAACPMRSVRAPSIRYHRQCAEDRLCRLQVQFRSNHIQHQKSLSNSNLRKGDSSKQTTFIAISRGNASNHTPRFAKHTSDPAFCRCLSSRRYQVSTCA
jgi:hypothetical protein